MYFKSIVFSFALVMVAVATPAQADTIVEIAAGNEDFSALVDAVVSQDLAGTLSSEGPFTVFAPTNDAFAKLPGYVTRALNKNPDLLEDILLYHVVAGDLRAADVLAEQSLESVQGEDLRVRSAGKAAFINSSRITATDIVADNGVIHVIDTVLIPSTVRQYVINDARAQINELRAKLQEMISAKQSRGYLYH
jgi:uncharacterized surface protein with fasciclin (FAS1) repeats